MAVLINKTAYDFQDLMFNISLVKDAGVNKFQQLAILPIADGIEEINYSPKFERQKMYGSSRIPQGRTSGVADFEASISMQFYWWRYIVETCRQLNIGVGQVLMNIQIIFTKNSPLADVPLYDVFLERCAIKTSDSAFKHGPDTLIVKVDLDPMNIYDQGVDPFGKSLT